MTFKKIGWVLLATGGIAVGVFMKSTSFDRPAMEAVVAQVRAAAPAPGEPREYWMEGKTLRTYESKDRPPRGQGAGHVWARLAKDGKLQVVIEVRDAGHAGEYGFAYSEIELTPAPFASGWFTIDVPGHLNLVQRDCRIDAQWWKVVHNLD
jgi:hypothetical protein